MYPFACCMTCLLFIIHLAIFPHCMKTDYSIIFYLLIIISLRWSSVNGEISSVLLICNILSLHTVGFIATVKKIGKDGFRFHVLRHSYAVAAIRAGDDMKTVSSNLGHTTISITMDIYASFTEDMAKASASRMNAYISSNF